MNFIYDEYKKSSQLYKVDFFMSLLTFYNFNVSITLGENDELFRKS